MLNNSDKELKRIMGSHKKVIPDIVARMGKKKYVFEYERTAKLSKRYRYIITSYLYAIHHGEIDSLIYIVSDQINPNSFREKALNGIDHIYDPNNGDKIDIKDYFKRMHFMSISDFVCEVHLPFAAWEI